MSGATPRALVAIAAAPLALRAALGLAGAGAAALRTLILVTVFIPLFPVLVTATFLTGGGRPRAGGPRSI